VPPLLSCSRRFPVGKNFAVLDPEEMKKIRAGLSPFFEDWALPCMCPGYHDGMKV